MSPNGRSEGRPSGPLYRWIADDVEAKIDSGTYGAGDKLPSEHSLCDLYGVSQITVRRALRELSHVGRVYSRHGLGWFVTDVYGPSSEQSRALLVLANLDWQSAAFVQGLVEQLATKRVRLELAFTGGRRGRETDIVAAAQAGGADIVLLVASGDRSEMNEHYESLLGGSVVPVIFVIHRPPDSSTPAVVLDEQRAMRDLTQHVLSLGYRSIAYAGESPIRASAWEHYWGFAPTLWEQGLELPLDWVFSGDLSTEDQASHLKRVFTAAQRPNALVCSSSDRAANALRILQQARLDCPADVAVVALGERDYSPLLSPPLTTYRFDMAALIDATASATTALLRGNPFAQVSIAGELSVRESSGAGARR